MSGKLFLVLVGIFFSENVGAFAGEGMTLLAEQISRSIPNTLPDARLTPGDVNPKLTKDVICASSFRTGPYRHVTVAQKKRIAKEYGLDYETTHAYVEYDHLISLELGGSNDDKNIWPEFYFPVPGARQKDIVENYLHSQVCEGHMALDEAQRKISGDWYAVYQEQMR